MRLTKIVISLGLALFLTAAVAVAAYHHGTDTDSDLYRVHYPAIAGTKLDSCATCHTGGEYLNHKGKLISVGSCQWCHYSYGYDESGNIDETLNAYGRDYNQYGKNTGALEAIAHMDSDGDGFSNQEEIDALRYPGDANDDPTKVSAPYRIFTREELEALPQHTQFMLMNTHKSGDFYAEYQGVTMADLLDRTNILLPLATGIQVFAADGWSQYHPLEPDPDPLFYHVYGPYPSSVFYYDPQADNDLNPDGDGWCDYSAPACLNYENGDPIDGLNMLLAIKRNGEYLISGELSPENKLDGEGPFRVVPPQKHPGPPDQSSKSDNQEVVWPFDELADHNAGYASRTATMIRVDPLPEGTTDVNTLEAGWNFVDEGKIIVYGAIDPRPRIMAKLEELSATLWSLDMDLFKRPFTKYRLVWRVCLLNKLIKKERDQGALRMIEKALMPKVDGCIGEENSAANDWIDDCETQKQIYWDLHELAVLLKILT